MHSSFCSRPMARRRASASSAPSRTPGRRLIKLASSAAIRIAASRRVQRSALTSRSRLERISCSGLGAEFDRNQLLGARATSPEGKTMLRAFTERGQDRGVTETLGTERKA
jgi:hypothetical protein